MPRTARLPDALRGRGKALVFAGSAAALIGAGTASAATIAPTASQPTAISQTASVQERALDAAATQGASTPFAPAAPVQHAATAVTRTTAPATRTTAPASRPTPKATLAAKARPHHDPLAHATHADPLAHAAHAAPRYEIYDSVTPSQIPAHHAVATYADGGYAVSPAALPHGKHVLWIDTNGSDPRASALDVEPGDATPAGAGAWAKAKLSADPAGTAIIYTMRSEWPAAKAAVAALPRPMQSHVKWWIADPTGVNHVVPGASATQWYWGKNYDITTAKHGF
jgi:hypothetical protein